MSTKKEDLLKKINSIEDEETLERILHFVEEEAAVYGRHSLLSSTNMS